MLLSVIIVTKDPGNELFLTLSSLLPLNLDDVEIILKDNSSDEDISRINDHFQFENFLFIRSPDKGIYDAMNQALERAKGTFVYFLNAGDQYIDIYLPEILKNGSDQTGFYYGDIVVLHPHTKLIKHTSFINRYTMYLKRINHQAMVIRRSAFEEFGNFDTELHINADFYFALKMVQSFTGKKIKKFISIYKGDGFSYRNTTSAEESRLLKRKLKNLYNPLEIFFLRLGETLVAFIVYLKNLRR